MSFRPGFINVRGRLIDLSVPRVMGIINVTPDSFYGKSRYTGDDEIIKAAFRMMEEGADFIDVGGYSTRPGAAEVSPDEERNRVINAVRIISRELPEIVISVDTCRSGIAREAVLEYGAAMINDISGGETDQAMFSTVEKLRVPYVMMHMQGTPGTMQNNPFYENVVADILKWFGERIHRLTSMGVNDIILDPGIGFGKTLEHNFLILKNLGDFSIAGLPVMAGVSRKSIIWKTLGIDPGEALNGTTVLNTVALLNGASILRVHDVREAVEAVNLVGKIKNSGIT